MHANEVILGSRHCLYWWRQRERAWPTQSSFVRPLALVMVRSGVSPLKSCGASGNRGLEELGKGIGVIPDSVFLLGQGRTSTNLILGHGASSVSRGQIHHEAVHTGLRS